MKKVQVWLTDDEHKALKEYCAKEGRSMYSVLKEGTIRILQGGVVSESLATSKPETTPFTPTLNSGESPALPAPSPQISSKLQKFEQRLDWQEKQIDKMAGNEQLWHEVSEVKAGVAELKGQVSGLIKMEELENKFDKKIVDTVAGVLEKLGILEERR